jgi:prepilin-type N-terminal cleavage/methylation domain-containing protein
LTVFSAGSFVNPFRHPPGNSIDPWNTKTNSGAIRMLNEARRRVENLFRKRTLRNAGYTLLELLVVIGILAVLLSCFTKTL